MRISALKLVNFKSYRNQVFDFPPPRQNKNLILIGGLNGFGKTSFLEALYLGLYGSEAMNYLGRAGLKLDRNATYSKFLTRAFNGNADADSPMSISVEFVDRYNDGFSITRTWYFDKNRSWYDEDMQIYSVENGVRKSVFGNFSFYSYKKACGQKKTVRGSKNSRRLSNGTPAI